MSYRSRFLRRIPASFRGEDAKKSGFFLQFRKLSLFLHSQSTEIDASLAQLVEHDTLNVGVQDSSPWGRTKRESFDSRFFSSHIRRAFRPFDSVSDTSASTKIRTSLVLFSAYSYLRGIYRPSL